MMLLLFGSQCVRAILSKPRGGDKPSGVGARGGGSLCVWSDGGPQ